MSSTSMRYSGALSDLYRKYQHGFGNGIKERRDADVGPTLCVSVSLGPAI